MSDSPVTQEECIKRNMEAVAKVNDRMDGIEGRVGRLEEQVGGDMGIIKALQAMQGALQDVRDTLNRQAFLVPVVTAIVTGVLVTIITRFIR